MFSAHCVHAAHSVPSAHACVWAKARTHRPCKLGKAEACGRQTARTAHAPRRCRAVAKASSAVEPAQGAGTGSADVVVQTAEPYITHTWRWREHAINYAVRTRVLRSLALVVYLLSADGAVHATAQVAGSGKPILIVHGFGASIGHFRRNIPELAQTHKVCKYGPACGASCCLHRS